MFVSLLQSAIQTVPVEPHSDSNVAMLIGLAFAIVKGTEKFGEWFAKKRNEKKGNGHTTVKLCDEDRAELRRIGDGVEEGNQLSHQSMERIEDVHSILDRRDPEGSFLVYGKRRNLD
jgi:hypothetical protein